MLKKIWMLALVLLLCLGFAACGEESAAEQPETATVSVYWNQNKTVPEADANGVYTLNFLCDGQAVTYTCADAELTALICRQDVLGLELEGAEITDAILTPHLPYELVAWNYYVKSIGGDQVKVNATSAFNSTEGLFTVTENTKIYDVSDLATVPGAETNLQKSDGITVLADKDGNAVVAYVVDRSAVPDAEPKYCQHCEQDVIWSAWYGKSLLPYSDGHYRLEQDMNLLGPTSVGDVELVVDLNGKRVEQTEDGQRIYLLAGPGSLSILDSVGTGVMRSANTYDQGTCVSHWGMIVDMEDVESEFNFYSGTLDASGRSVQYGGAINATLGTINMYGGTILAADPYGTGSGAIRCGGLFNMYGGKIVGGKHQDIGYVSINAHAGAVMRISENAVFNMYGGEIVGGESHTYGGIIAAMKDGKINLYGGSISGGKSAKCGSAIYVDGTSTLKICGNPQIFDNEGDNICIGLGGYFEIDEMLTSGAKVGISMENPGVVCKLSSIDCLDGIFSDNPELEFVLAENGFLYLE